VGKQRGRKVIFTHGCFLNETQRDRARWVPERRSDWAQTCSVFGQMSVEGGLAADGWDWDERGIGMGAGPGLNLWPVVTSVTCETQLWCCVHPF